MRGAWSLLFAGACSACVPLGEAIVTLPEDGTASSYVLWMDAREVLAFAPGLCALLDDDRFVLMGERSIFFVDRMRTCERITP